MPFPWRRQPVLRVLITSQLTAQRCQNRATNAGPSLTIWSAKQIPGHTEENFSQRGEIKGQAGDQGRAPTVT